MDKLRRSLLISPLALSAAGAALDVSAQSPGIIRASEPAAMIDLWPQIPAGQLHPDMKEITEEVTGNEPVRVRRTQGTSRPRMALFRPDKPNGGAMLIIPGGGFTWNYFEHEGYQVADYFRAQGLTCFVLFYRLANDGWDKAADVGTIDAQRAMRVIRKHAAQYGLDPARVGVMGFSAGGFVTASLATRHAQVLYAPVDDADAVPARPSLAASIYPVISLDPAIAYAGTAPSLLGGPPTPEQIARYAPDHNVDAQTPPMFLTQAEDDGTVPVANSLVMRAAMKAAGRVVETHLFATGGHGFGMKPAPDQPHHIWPQLLTNFARQNGLMG
ncbi:MAG: alpha/beta hydrolase [Asticcacaulis sp.]